MAFIFLFVVMVGGALIWAFLKTRSKARKEGAWLGVAGAKAAFLWNHADKRQRLLMLSAIGILEDNSDLAEKNWPGLPGMVAISLCKTLEEIRKEPPSG